LSARSTASGLQKPKVLFMPEFVDEKINKRALIKNRHKTVISRRDKVVVNVKITTFMTTGQIAMKQDGF